MKGVCRKRQNEKGERLMPSLDGDLGRIIEVGMER